MNLVTELIIIYFSSINLFSFLLFGIDKYKAEIDGWRISEKRLFLISFFGGIFGSLIGMKLFRHKTKKSNFKLVMFGITLWNIILYSIITYYIFNDLTTLCKNFLLGHKALR